MNKASAIFMQEVTDVFDDLEQTLIAYEKHNDEVQMQVRLCELWHTVKVLLTVSGLSGLAGLGGVVLRVFEKYRNDNKAIPDELFDQALATLAFLGTSLRTLLAKSLKPGPDAEQSISKETEQFCAKWNDLLPDHLREPSACASNKLSGKRPRVLIVDDEFINRMLLEETIRKTSPAIDIVAVESAEEGLYHYFTSHFDLVFLDIMMPTIDGNHFISIVQKNREAGLLKSPRNIVVQTAVESMEQLVSYARRECIQEVIRKPLPFDRIKECVERYCL